MPRLPGLVRLLAALLACSAVAAAQGHGGDEYVLPPDGAAASDEDYASLNSNSTDLQEMHECLEAERLEAAADGHCGPHFDRVLCWRGQPAGTLATKSCFAELNGVYYDNVGRNATRWCLGNGTWSHYSNYSACMVEAQLEQAEAEDPTPIITSTIYYVGYIVSTVALTVAVFIFSYFRELHCLRNRIHMNLMLAYIGADIVWMLNMTVNVYLIEHISQAFCYIFIVLLHYTMLTHFLWMFVEGLYLYTLVVKTFQQGTAKLPVYLVIGWGVPLVVIVSWVVTRLLHPIDAQAEHVRDDDVAVDGLNKLTCSWLVYPHWSDWMYQAPVIAVLALNTIFLCFVMYVLITKLRSDMRPGAMGPPGDAEQQQSKKAAKALLVLIPLLGITYILVIAGPTEGHAANVFALVRAVLLSTQGLLVAIFYCFLNTDVRHTLANRWERWREVRTLGRQRNGRAASVNWTNRDTEHSVHHGQLVADKVTNGHDQQRVSWLDKPAHVEAHM